MKKIKIVPIFLIAFALLFSCEKGNDFKESGVRKIYMPQAAVFDGGVTNNYPVPNNTGGAENYVLDSVNNILNIYLGAKSSGLLIEPFTVNIKENRDTTMKIIDAEAIPKAVILPEDTYTLPTSASTGTGKNEAPFVMSVDINKLNAEYSQYNKKKLILGVTISGPSELNKELATTIVVIDAQKFMDTPPPFNAIKGGDMNDGDEAFWTIIKQKDWQWGADYVTTPPVIRVANGVMSYLDNKKAGYVNTAIYQKVHVEKDKKYKVSLDFSISGNLKDAWLRVHIGTAVPVPNDSYADNQFWAIDTWNNGPCMKSPMTANFADLTCKIGSGKDSGNIYTATATGDVYFLIMVGSTTPNVGQVERVDFDNVKMLEITEE